MLKERTWWLFWLGENTWITLSPNIYYPKGIDVNRYPHVIAHEKVHIRQQSQGSYLGWMWKYLTSKSFRLQQEAEAYGIQIRFERENNIQTNTLENAAINLSGEMYRYAAASKEEAIEAIKKYV